MKPFLKTMVALCVVFGQVHAQHDSLSCRTALGELFRQKRDMQTLLEYSEKDFYAKLPRYSRGFHALLDSINRYGLWRYIPDPLELKIEEARLVVYNNPSSDKARVKTALEKMVADLKGSTHKVEFAEFCNYLGTIYFQEGQVGKNTSLYQEAIQALEESRMPEEAPSMLEWMLRAKFANLLCKSDPLSALSTVGGIRSLDMAVYQHYAVNPWRTEHLENTVSSAWEALGNVYSCLGDARSAISAYESALKYTRPERTTWDSAILCLIQARSGLEDSTEVRRLIELVRSQKPENLFSVYLVAGYAFYLKRNLAAASGFYRDAFESIGNSTKDEQVEILSNLVNVYSEMHAEDLVYQTLNVLLKDPSFIKEDNLAYRYCRAAIDIGIRIQKNKGSAKAYFSGAESILNQKRFGRDFLRDPYAGKFLMLLSRLYIARQNPGDLEKAETVLIRIIDGNREAAKRLNLQGEYGSDDAVYAKLCLAAISEIKGNLSMAIDSYKHLVSDYSSKKVHGTLAFHDSEDGVDSSASALLRISEAFIKTKFFEQSLELCDWLSRQNNLPSNLKELAEFRTERVNYYWGFLDKTKFQKALVAFNGISDTSRFRLESEFLAALCKWHLDFKQAAVDELIVLFTKLRTGPSTRDKTVAFLIDENIIGYTRVFSGNVFLQGDGGKAQQLLEALLDAISKNGIDTPEEAKALYALAHFHMRDGLPGEERLRKVDSLLEAFFRNRYAAADLWTYFRAGELKMDLDFELGRLSSASIRQQIDRLQHFNGSEEALEKIVESTNFYKGPGLVSLENLDMGGLKEKVQELLAKCYCMAGRLSSQQERWSEALDAYDTVLDKYARFDLYASRALYYEGLIYLTSLNRIDKAVSIFTRLFLQYDNTQVAVQAKEDLREAGRFAKQPNHVSAWFHASKKMFETFTQRRLSSFAIDLAFCLAERHVGEDDRFTRDETVMSAVIRGFEWVARLQDTLRVPAADIAKANLVLARAYRLESDLKPGSVYGRHGVTYPEKNGKKENACYRRVMDSGRPSAYFGNAQWHLTVNLALMGKSEESKGAAWVYPAFESANVSLREQYEKEIGVLIAYMAPGKTNAYNKDVRLAVETIVGEARTNGLLPYLETFFDTTRKQVQILKLKTGRPDIHPELLDLTRYANGKWFGGGL